MKPDSIPVRISLRDIAKKLGVSHVTVSLALRDNPRISTAVREKVKAAAEEMGYQPDPMLAALAHYRKGKTEIPITSSIAWVNCWSDPDDLRNHGEFDAYWKGANTAAGKFGYRIEEFRMNGDYTPQRLNQILSARGIRGILLPPHSSTPAWEDFPWEKYFVVRFGRSLRKPVSHLVASDQVENAMLAFEQILAHGYKRIGFVTDERESRNVGHLFEAGFLLAQRNLPESERLAVCHINPKQSHGSAQILNNWIHEQKPDAIFTDERSVPQYLKELGLNVPGDIGLAGTSILDCEVDAGINQNPEEIGRVAFHTLNALINESVRGLPAAFRQILIGGTWVDGSTLPDKTIS